ncbi:MAG TPA: hypothetical protein VFD92_17830 [Candidatus Binatia bacterium]|nr:hypothetical protein [Candidatus Binatia bacterium]
MKKTCVLLAFCVLLGLPAAAGAAAADTAKPTILQGDMGILLDAIRANRKAIVSANLQLSPDEATRFWPVYDRYQGEMNAIGNRIAALIDDYTAHFSALSDEKALQIVNAYVGAEAERIKVRQTYVDEFAKAVPGRTVARFYQIENKMDAVLRYDLAATIPVVDEKAAPEAK